MPRLPLGRAVALAETVLEPLRSSPGVAWAVPVGSLRRGQDSVGDIEILAATDRPSAAMAVLLDASPSPHVVQQSEHRLLVLSDHVEIGVRLVDPANAGSTLLHLTGSEAHL